MAVRGSVTIEVSECKGCGVCVEACPPKKLALSADLNAYGAHPVQYSGEGCTGCGICFYVCPEPGAITVFRSMTSSSSSKAQESIHAASL